MTLQVLPGGTQAEVERRDHQRVTVSLLGRCMFPDQREIPVQLEDMSPGGAVFSCARPGQVGDRVIAYVDHLGRLEGAITRVTADGFAMSIIASPRKREKIADTLTWLANRHILNLPEGRRHERRTPKRPDAVLIISDGTEHDCRVIDISFSGAALATALRPKLGTRVDLGQLGCRVVRHFEDGIGVEFMQSMCDSSIEELVEKEFF